MTPSELMDEIKELLQLCHENIEDELENKPVRHALGRVNARLKHVLEIVNGSERD